MEKLIQILLMLTLVKCEDEEIQTGEYVTIGVYYALSFLIIILSLVFINSKL